MRVFGLSQTCKSGPACSLSWKWMRPKLLSIICKLPRDSDSFLIHSESWRKKPITCSRVVGYPSWNRLLVKLKIFCCCSTGTQSTSYATTGSSWSSSIHSIRCLSTTVRWRLLRCTRIHRRRIYLGCCCSLVAFSSSMLISKCTTRPASGIHSSRATRNSWVSFTFSKSLRPWGCSWRGKSSILLIKQKGRVRRKWQDLHILQRI